MECRQLSHQYLFLLLSMHNIQFFEEVSFLPLSQALRLKSLLSKHPSHIVDGSHKNDTCNTQTINL